MRIHDAVSDSEKSTRNFEGEWGFYSQLQLNVGICVHSEVSFEFQSFKRLHFSKITRVYLHLCVTISHTSISYTSHLCFSHAIACLLTYLLPFLHVHILCISYIQLFISAYHIPDIPTLHTAHSHLYRVFRETSGSFVW